MREQHLFDQQGETVAASKNVGHQLVRRPRVEQGRDQIADVTLVEQVERDDIDDVVSTQ